MKKRVFSFALVIAMCLSLIPATAMASGYTATKLGIKANAVWNVNGYATTESPTDTAGYATDANLIDSAGNVVRVLPGIPTDDGYYLNGYTLYDASFNEVLRFSPYEKIHGEPSLFGGSTYDVVANGGVIAIINEPLVLLDYSGNVTGRYTPDALHIDPYGAGRGVNIGSDGILTVWLGQYTGMGDEYKWVIVDKAGNVLADLGGKYSNIGTFNEGLTYAFVPDGEGGYDAYYIDTAGRILFSIDAIYLSNFLDGYAFAGVSYGESLKFGIIDKSGKWVIEPQYEIINSVSQGVFAVKKEGKYGYVDAKNNVLVPFEYDNLSSYKQSVGYGVKDGELYAIKLENVATSDAPSSWAVPELNAAIAMGLVPENLQRNYRSDVSRGDVAQMFINLIEKASGQSIDDFMDSKNVSIDGNAFTDTNDRAVLAANALGIIQGVGNSRFDPNGTLTRAQIAAIINRVARVIGVDTEGYTHGFTDVAGHWVSVELGWPVHAGIIKGESATSLNPNGNLTTEQAIAITYRALAPLSQ